MKDVKERERNINGRVCVEKERGEPRRREVK